MSRENPGASPSQADVLAFLGNPESYPHRPHTVERIETHGAYVFLAGDQVFKIKRAVQFSYMNFSTLDLRRAACEREISINKPQAPAIYRGLTAITRKPDGSLAFDGSGEIVEWAVHMTRFSEADVLVNKAADGPFETGLSKALADAVYRYHEQAGRPEPHDFAAQIGAIVADVSSTLADALPADDYLSVLGLTGALETEAGRLTPLFAKRASTGHVRRCHGDLHLANIVLIDGTPVLFDALEFNEEMATIDTLYDLAFLIMDLDHRNQHASANTVLNRYLWRSQDMSDIAGLAALPLYMALRAAIRAMVRAQRARQAPSPNQGAGPITEARSYVARAASYLKPQTPVLVLVGGLSGTGKSTLAHRLAPLVGRSPGALHLRTDLERKALYGAEELERLPSEAYTHDVTERVYGTVLAKAETALGAGHSVIGDAVHADPAERQRIASLAATARARLVTLWLDAPAEVLMSRVASRSQDASDATPQIVSRQLTYELGDLDWTRIDASGTPEDTFRNACEILQARLPVN